MKSIITVFSFLLCISFSLAQKGIPTDYLSSTFHKERREALRKKMPSNSVAIFFANAVRNRANDVDYVYHQDPNFYYLTGYQEPNAVLLIFSESQKNKEGNIINEIMYVQERNALAEQWNGYRLGVEGVQEKLGFSSVFNGKDFLNSGIDFTSFDSVFFKEFDNDYRDDPKDNADLYSLIASFKSQVGYTSEPSLTIGSSSLNSELKGKSDFTPKSAKMDTKSLGIFMAGLRQTKTEEELVLLTKAIRISAIGQIEIMKAMHPNMSEREIQGVHEFVYKKYGSEFEGYPSIVGAGNNGCVLHYIDNNKMSVENDLVLMDLGAEYRGYTADVTRTIPPTGKFSQEQKLIYDLVYQAQEAGIAVAVVGNDFRAPDVAARKVINAGLVKLGITKTETEGRTYFPHGTSHHLGLDVHDPSLGGPLQSNMVITVEPGIYIPDGSACDKKWWGIAVRIEDDILVTTNGPVNLSAEAPRRSEDIEKLMQEKSVLDSFVLPSLD